VLFHVGLSSFHRVVTRMVRVTRGGVGVVGGFFVMSGLVVLGRFAVVLCRVSMVFCGVLMVLGCFLGHSDCFLC
jgi:hypothetical protein